MRLHVFSFCLLTSALSTAAQTGFVEDIVVERKYSCNSSKLVIYSVGSQIQCVSRCSMQENCNLMNYKGGIGQSSPKNNCEIYTQINKETKCSLTVASEDWHAIKFQRVVDEPTASDRDECSLGMHTCHADASCSNTKESFTCTCKAGFKGNGTHCSLYDNCKAIYDENNAALDGIYNLKSGKHYCMMSSIGECGSGWTIAMAINGSKQTFEASSSYWKNDMVYNVMNGLNNPKSEEAKYPAYSNIGFTSVCIGMKYNNIQRWLLIPQAASSLLHIFKDDVHKQTNLGRAKWKGLIRDSSLQLECNMEGFNAYKPVSTIFARIGIMSNNDPYGNSCSTPNSYIGLGTVWSHVNTCVPNLVGVSCGNLALCDPDNGDKSLAAFGMILIR